MRILGTARNAQDSSRGVALIYAVFGSVVVASMVSVMFTMAGVSDKRADVRRGRGQARYLAEGALRTVVKDMQASLAAWEEPVAEGTKTVAGVVVDYTVEPIGAQVQYVEPSGVVNLVQPYEVEARVSVDGVSEIAHRLVNAKWTPLFQFAVFYNSDLEIHAGPNMTLRGRVHSNQSMFIGGGSTITLDTNYVRAIGGIFRATKRSGNAAGGNVDIRRWVANPFDPSEPSVYERMLSQAQLPVDSVSGYDSAFRDGFDFEGNGSFFDPNDWLPFELGAAAFWGEPSGYSDGNGQTVMTGQHGAQEAVTAPIGSIQMYEESAGGAYSLDPNTGEYFLAAPGEGSYAKGYYHGNAGLSIIREAGTNSFQVFDANGNDVTPFVGAAISMTTVPDMRQSGSGATRVSALQVDLGLLAGTPYFPSNGLIFAAHESMGTGIEANGLVLTNGGELAAGLTVVSPGAVYVHGDYNVVDKKGASVIGDAVNLLSNSWDGTKAPGTLPGASATTFNVAMVTGSYDTVPGRYNGGLENLPRFHENWSGVSCNISGSFVNLYDSQFATSDWQYGGDRYTAPIRNWQYDERFNSLDDLPPFTPMAVTAENVVSW